MPKKADFEENLPNWDPRRLKQVRAMKHMTQEDFAKYCGMPVVNISNIERNIVKPSAIVIAAVARLGYDINWFLNGVNQDDALLHSSINDFGLLAETKNLNPKQAKFLNLLVKAFLETVDEK